MSPWQICEWWAIAWFQDPFSPGYTCSAGLRLLLRGSNWGMPTVLSFFFDQLWISLDLCMAPCYIITLCHILTGWGKQLNTLCLFHNYNWFIWKKILSSNETSAWRNMFFKYTKLVVKIWHELDGENNLSLYL